MLNILFESFPALSITSTQSDAVRNLYSMITDLLQIVQLLLFFPRHRLDFRGLFL